MGTRWQVKGKKLIIEGLAGPYGNQIEGRGDFIAREVTPGSNGYALTITLPAPDCAQRCLLVLHQSRLLDLRQKVTFTEPENSGILSVKFEHQLPLCFTRLGLEKLLGSDASIIISSNILIVGPKDDCKAKPEEWREKLENLLRKGGVLVS